MAGSFPAFTSVHNDTRDMLRSLQTSNGLRTSDGTRGDLDFIHDLTNELELPRYALAGRRWSSYKSRTRRELSYYSQQKSDPLLLLSLAKKSSAKSLSCETFITVMESAQL